MKVTYINTLYGTKTAVNVFGNIDFVNGKLVFNAGGHGYEIDSKLVIKIEPIES